jgi:hypothetical protein
VPTDLGEGLPMSPVLTPEKVGMPSMDLIAKERGSEIMGFTIPEIEDIWKQIVMRCREDGEDIAQEALYRVLKRANRDKVEKPLHYLARTARHIAINLGKRREYAQAYKQAIIGKRPDGRPAREATSKGSSVVFNPSCGLQTIDTIGQDKQGDF